MFRTLQKISHSLKSNATNSLISRKHKFFNVQPHRIMRRTATKRLQVMHGNGFCIYSRREKTKHAPLKIIHSVFSASSKPMHQCRLRSQLGHQARCQLYKPLYKPFLHQLEVWEGALPVLTPYYFTAKAASCVGFEKLVV